LAARARSPDSTPSTAATSSLPPEVAAGAHGSAGAAKSAGTAAADAAAVGAPDGAADAAADGEAATAGFVLARVLA
jgi:hypothetical protein